MFDAHGKPLKDEEADDERAVKYQECSEQKNNSKKNWNKLNYMRKKSSWSGTRRPSCSRRQKRTRPGRATHNGTKAWYVSFQTDEAWQLEEWISGKQDWDGVKLALAHAVDSGGGQLQGDVAAVGGVAAWCRMDLNPTCPTTNPTS